MMETKLVKTLMIKIIITIVLATVFQMAVDFSLKGSFSDTVEMNGPFSGTADDLKYNTDRQGVLKVLDYSVEDDRIHVTLIGSHPGEAFLEFHDKKTGEMIAAASYSVTNFHLVVNDSTKNSTGYRYHFILIILCLFLSAIWFWQCFYESVRRLGYSYVSIFSCGFAVWITVIACDMMWMYTRQCDMVMVLGSLSSSEFTFMAFTAPVVLVFSICLAVSNLELIRHERPRFRNMLGIILAGILLAGMVIPVLISFLFTRGSELQMNIFDAFLNAYGAGYVLFECFLIGSIVCGTMAALHHPKMDKDFIIILGCKIRKDGTLYPLIQGRVDRAIRFYKEQWDVTGKKAVFVPSGGKGSDETISEAEAMGRYLLEQEIPEEQIMIEDQSKNTIENMRFSRKLIEDKNPDAKVAFSTTNFHVFRSGIISRQAGFAPEGMGGKTKWYFWPNAYMRECLGMIVYTKKSLILMYIFIAVSFAIIPFMV